VSGSACVGREEAYDALSAIKPHICVAGCPAALGEIGRARRAMRQSRGYQKAKGSIVGREENINEMT